jgi:hypothetical protein
MFAIGCIQSLTCHTDRCPSGVATQDPTRARALDVPDKAQRVAQFDAVMLKALAELVAADLGHPAKFRPEHFRRGVSVQQVRCFSDLYARLPSGALLHGSDDPRFAPYWDLGGPPELPAPPDFAGLTRRNRWGDPGEYLPPA